MILAKEGTTQSDLHLAEAVGAAEVAEGLAFAKFLLATNGECLNTRRVP